MNKVSLFFARRRVISMNNEAVVDAKGDKTYE